MTVSLKRGGLLAPVLILPLSIPVLIFGVASVTGRRQLGGTAVSELR